MEVEQTIYLEFAEKPAEQLVINPHWTGQDLCVIIAERVWTHLSPSALVLINKSGDVLLDPEQPLSAQNVLDEDRIVVLRSRRKPLSGKFYARLREAEMGDVYPIKWQPAIIGRPGHVRDKELLAVDLEWLPDGLSVSRNHAIIYERNEQFFIRHIAGEHNQTAVNGHLLAPNENHRLHDGDAITLGHRQITLSFLLSLAHGV